MILLCCSLIGQAQSKEKNELSKEFQVYLNRVYDSPDNFDQNIELIVENTKTPYKKVFAYSAIGTRLYQKGRYLQAIQFYKKAKDFDLVSDLTEFKISYTDGLIISYRRAGLINQSYEEFV